MFLDKSYPSSDTQWENTNGIKGWISGKCNQREQYKTMKGVERSRSHHEGMTASGHHRRIQSVCRLESYFPPFIVIDDDIAPHPQEEQGVCYQ